MPQFLTVEDTIIGPITVRQFLEMLAGGLLIALYYRLFDFSLFIIASLLTAGIVAVFAFARPHGQNFHDFLLNFLATFKSPKLKVWRRGNLVATVALLEKKAPAKKVSPGKVKAKEITASRLSELSLIVDTGGVYRGENDLPL